MVRNKCAPAVSDDPETSILLDMTNEILKSKTGYSVSLSANIRSFHRAMNTEKRLDRIESEVFKKRIAADRRKEERRENNTGPPDGVERRSGLDRRISASGE